MAYHRRGHVCCRGCGIQGVSLQIIHHYLWDELPLKDVPFQCQECNARFHHRHAATWHMETEHGYHKPITEAFTGTLRDLPVYQMVEDQDLEMKEGTRGDNGQGLAGDDTQRPEAEDPWLFKYPYPRYQNRHITKMRDWSSYQWKPRSGMMK